MTHGPSVSREANRRWIRLPRFLVSLEALTLRVEAPIRRWVSSNRLNPIPHAGTISVFLLLVVVVSGVYITLFFEFGFEASYRSVAKLEEHPIQRLMRAVHRYSSAGLVLTTLVHAWRSLVMTRFTGPRRWRWMTGAIALLVVWLAGVTGYWLIWDRRAQALNEAMFGLIEVGAGGVRFLVDHVVGSTAGSGWQLLLAIWFLHLLLTVLVGWLVWRHLRFTRHRWLPPKLWMWLMAGALTLTSIAVPAGMLPPADSSRLPAQLPIDLFVMFLLPPLLAWSPWVVLGIGVVLLGAGMVLPWVLRKGDPPVVEILEPACTGCELCVLDCPYRALEMAPREDAAPLAVVDPGRCVGCGICLGSCVFDAIRLPGYEPAASENVAGRAVAFTCERHLAQVGTLTGDVTVVPLACAGMLDQRSVGGQFEHEAARVHVVGCPPADCLYGMGNLLAAERLNGARAPRLPRVWQGRISEDWIVPTELPRAIARPGSHPVAVADATPTDRRRLTAAGALVLVSTLVVALATGVPAGGEATEAEVVVLVSHVPGARLVGRPEPSGSPGVVPEIEVVADGAVLAAEKATLSGDTAVAFTRVRVDPHVSALRVSLMEEGVDTVLYDGPADLEPGRRLLLEARDVPPPADVETGRRLFTSSGVGANLGCSTCHSTEPEQILVGPSLAGIADRAGRQVAGMDAETYLRRSILAPDEFVVEGFRAGQMPSYTTRIEQTDLDAVVVYLMTLTEEDG